ncbi:MAG TPA: hypothetical protein VF017_14725 [Thermoanaerobaculia bacterium]|nr:hypothetical protein [Thermoanaerobaculia bacterium]
MTETEPDLLPEQDFRGGVRGKHAKAYAQGHAVVVHHSDGTTTTTHFTLEDGAVLLAPDVRRYFPDSESVNEALRSLIKLASSQVPLEA